MFFKYTVPVPAAVGKISRQKTKKKIRTKYETLKKRGIDKQKAWEWANTSKKYWRVACSPILHLALGDAFLEKQGWTWIGLAGAPVEWSAC